MLQHNLLKYCPHATLVLDSVHIACTGRERLIRTRLIRSST